MGQRMKEPFDKTQYSSSPHSVSFWTSVDVAQNGVYTSRMIFSDYAKPRFSGPHFSGWSISCMISPYDDVYEALNTQQQKIKFETMDNLLDTKNKKDG